MVSRLRRRLRNGFELPATCVWEAGGGGGEVRRKERRSSSPPSLPHTIPRRLSLPASLFLRAQIPGAQSLPPSESCLCLH